MIDPMDLLRKVTQQEREFRSKQFVAPYTLGSKQAIVSMRKGMLYCFNISGFKGSGIGIFKPTTPNDAVWSEDAPFDKVRAYMEALPRMQLILSYQNDQGWLAYPFNLAAASKFGVDGPVKVLNVSDAQRFDAITARYDGANFWYDEIFAGADPSKADQLRESFEKGKKIDTVVKGIMPEELAAFEIACEAWKQFAKLSFESQIRQTLEGSGGRMRSFVVRGKNVEIKWASASGEVYNSLVDKETLDVVSAGICLSGEDDKFHLKDLPHIIEQGERRRLIVVTRHFRIPDEDLDDE